MKQILFTLFNACFIFQASISQNVPVDNRWIEGFWDAYWIAHPTASAKEYGVFHFRKTFDLESKPKEFIINVSADNRYKLFVNGKEVGYGPARGDIQHWRFESLDIAEYLNTGKNVLAAVVWNFGIHAPVAQITQQTAFILQGNSEKEMIVNTDENWKVYQNPAYAPELVSRRELRTYVVVGPGDIVTGSQYPWSWESVDFNDENWEKPLRHSLGQGFAKGTDGNWMLVPRRIPLMQKYPLRLKSIRRTEGISVPAEFLNGNHPLTIPPDSQVSILLDQSYLTTGYPDLTVSRGKNSKVKISYSEALYVSGNNLKGDRNEIDGKQMRGYADIFYPDGGYHRNFRPLWNRTWRYLQLDIVTSDEPLIIQDIRGEYSGYPFEEKASFFSDQTWLSEVWDVGWRTALLCAGETYFDCPYYEQLQYVGDTRIQALISLYVSGDDRMMRRAIDDFNESRLWNGLTQSRYPCAKLQVIPPYSLFWIAMIYDHWLHKGDEEYVRDLLPGIQGVLHWYENQVNEKGLLGNMNWWHFTDWADEWPWRAENRIGGVPDTDEEGGNSSVLTIQYVYALLYAEKLHRSLGFEYLADIYKRQRTNLIQSIRTWCWDEEVGLFRDIPDSAVYSQHVNIMAILTDAIPQDNQKALMTKILNDKSLIQATFYFKFYLFRALVKTGMADLYISELQPWKKMLDMGLTTFAEKPDPTRSDCHAWSASPNYDLLATVAGIRPAEPGFQSVLITPFMGPLLQVEASMPHPNGQIDVSLNKTKEGLRVRINLPEDLTGNFEWQQHRISLKPGLNEFTL